VGHISSTWGAMGKRLRLSGENGGQVYKRGVQPSRVPAEQKLNDRTSERMHKSINEAAAQAAAAVAHMDSGSSESDIARKLSRHTFKAASDPELLSMGSQEACQAIVTKTMQGFVSACGEAPWFFCIDVPPVLCAAAWEILRASGHVIDRPDDLINLITLEYEDKLDRHLLERAMWQVTSELFNDNKVQNKVYQAISRSYWPALDETLGPVVLQERFAKEIPAAKELENVESFTRKWMEQALTRAWSALEHMVPFPLTRDIVQDLFRQLVAPFGAEDPFSCYPGALTEQIGRPPVDWAFITTAVTELFERWKIKEDAASDDRRRAPISTSKLKVTKGLRYGGYGPDLLGKREVKVKPQGRKETTPALGRSWEEVADSVQTNPVPWPKRLKAKPQGQAPSKAPKGSIYRESEAPLPKWRMPVKIEGAASKKRGAFVPKEFGNQRPRQHLAEACSKRYQRLSRNTFKPHGAYVQTKAQTFEEEEDDIEEEDVEVEEEEFEQMQEEEEQDEEQAEQEEEQGDEEQDAMNLEVEEQDDLDMQMQASWQEESEQGEEVSEQGIGRHPRCTSAEDCIGSPDCQLIQHYHKGKKADIYCSMCWDSFTSEHTSLMGRLLAE